jgi:hypothetical protein
MGGVVEIHHAKHRPVIGEGEGRHLEFARPLDKGRNPAQPIQQ